MQRYYLAIGTITLSGFGLWLALTITDSPEHAKDALVDTISTTTPNSLITSECQEYYENIFPNAPEYGTFAEYNTSTSTTAPTTTEVDTESHSVAKRFYTHHETALDNQSRQFAGAYRISSWSFTGIGTMLAAVDTRDGSVHPFPYIIDWDFDFRPNSNLLIINPKSSLEGVFSSDAEPSCEARWYQRMKTYYFLFSNDQFVLLGPDDASGLQTSPWLQNEPMLE